MTTKRLSMTIIVAAFAASLLGSQAGCFLGLIKKHNRETNRRQKSSDKYQRYTQKLEGRLRSFMALTPPRNLAEVKFLHKEHSSLQYQLSRRYVPGGSAYKPRFYQWADTVRPKLDGKYLQLVVAGIRKIGARLPDGGHIWLAKVLRRLQNKKWRGPQANLWPDIVRSNTQRVMAAQQTFSPRNGYFSHRGCVASVRPLPRQSRRLPITFHLRDASRVYMRCYLKSTVAGMAQGRPRFRMWGKARMAGRRGSVRVPIDISASRGKRYVDFSFDLRRVTGGNAKGVLHVGFQYSYLNGYRRRVSGDSVRIVPNYGGLYVYGVYTFGSVSRASR